MNAFYRNKPLQVVLMLVVALLAVLMPVDSGAQEQRPYSVIQSKYAVEVLVSKLLSAPDTERLAREINTPIATIREQNLKKTIERCRDGRGQWIASPVVRVEDRAASTVWATCLPENRGLMITPGKIRITRRPMPVRTRTSSTASTPQFADVYPLIGRIDHLETNLTANNDQVLDELEKLKRDVGEVNQIALHAQTAGNEVAQNQKVLVGTLSRQEQAARLRHGVLLKKLGASKSTDSSLYYLGLLAAVTLLWFLVLVVWQRSIRRDLKKEREANVIASAALSAALHHEAELQKERDQLKAALEQELDLAARNKALQAAATEIEATERTEREEAEKTIRMHLFIIAAAVGCALERNVSAKELARAIQQHVSMPQSSPSGLFAAIEAAWDDIKEKGVTLTTTDDFWLLVSFLDQPLHLDLELLFSVDGDIPEHVKALVNDPKYKRHVEQLLVRGLPWIARELSRRSSTPPASAPTASSEGAPPSQPN